MKMADMPAGAGLIDNPVSVAPGFRIENVYVLPGVPKIMQAMLDGLLPGLRGGAKVLSRAISVLAAEGDVAAAWRRCRRRIPALEVGSYPFWRPERPSATIVFRGTDRRRSTPRPRRCWNSPPGSAPPRARTRRAAERPRSAGADNPSCKTGPRARCDLERPGT